jgi:hypothetical protein
MRAMKSKPMVVFQAAAFKRRRRRRGCRIQ